MRAHNKEIPSLLDLIMDEDCWAEAIKPYHGHSYHKFDADKIYISYDNPYRKDKFKGRPAYDKLWVNVAIGKEICKILDFNLKDHLVVIPHVNDIFSFKIMKNEGTGLTLMPHGSKNLNYVRFLWTNEVPLPGIKPLTAVEHVIYKGQLALRAQI